MTQVAAELAERLGSALRAAGFGGQPAIDLRAEGRGQVLAPVDSLVALGRSDDARLSLLLKLFSDCRTLSPALAAQALAPLELEELVDAGLLELRPVGVRTRVRVSDFDGLVFAGDPGRRIDAADYVIPITQSSKRLANVTVRRKVGAALDLGTGSGVQALLAARHADTVVAVDINPHALNMARISERLSGMTDRVRWVEGDWREAVEDARFDLVVSNPPYVVSPDVAFLYRDSAHVGDELSRQVVEDCAAALAEGGFATVRCNWIHGGDDWEQPVRAWMAGLGCDALLLRNSSEDPLVYALLWNARRADRDPDGFDETVNRWMTHYRRIGVDRIATGYVIMRRRSATSNWIAAFDDVGAPAGPAGDQLERMFRGGDFLHMTDGRGQLAALLAGAWRLPPGHRIDQTAAYAEGAYVGRGTMRYHPDTGLHAEIDPMLLPVLLSCDGTRSLGELLEASPIPAGMDRAGFHGLVLTAARDLIARGYLLPAENP